MSAYPVQGIKRWGGGGYDGENEEFNWTVEGDTPEQALKNLARTVNLLSGPLEVGEQIYSLSIYFDGQWHQTKFEDGFPRYSRKISLER